MRNGDGTTGAFFSDADSDTDSMSTDRSAFSGPLVPAKEASNKTAQIPPEAAPQLGVSSLGSRAGGSSTDEDDDVLEITLRVHNDSVVVYKVKPGGNTSDGPELTLMGRRRLEKSLFQNTSSPEAAPRLGGSSLGSRPGGSSADEDDDVVQITLDIRDDDSDVVHKVKPAGNSSDDPEVALMRRLRLEKKSSSFMRSSVFGNTSWHLRQQKRFDKNNSARLKFISGAGDCGWWQVERRFDHLTGKTNSYLHRSFFAECIGMNEESEGFANKVFRALAQRRNISGDSINKEQLRDFWDQLTDQSFDSRLHTFFDMLDKDSDGRISREEVAEMICVCASANNLKNMSSDEKAKEYAALIMEELDLHNLGFIMLDSLEMLLLQLQPSDQSVRISDRRMMSLLMSQKLNPTQETNPVYRWYHKTTLMYLSAVPVILYGSERLIRPFRSSSKPLRILKVALYPGAVLALHMSKPNGFKYKSGQYIFVNCSAVSRFEWHPFYITSSPGDDYLSVHIQTLGDWTGQLKTVFSAACQQAPADYSLQDQYPPRLPKIVIDGPYGAPTQDYKKYDVVLLVGTGIGATPMVSIIKDIVNNIKNMNEGSWFSRTRKAYFYWVTREQGSFEWFKGIMDDVVEMDKSRVIELHNYCTSVYEEGDARSAIIEMIQSLHHAKTGVDVVSGTRVKTHFGNPNWRKVYNKIALNHPETRVGVFYCGTAGLTKDLRNLSLDFSHKTSTKFDFYKNNL